MSSSARSTAILAAVVVVAVVAMLGLAAALGSSRAATSTAEVAAEVEPSEPPPITVPVERRALVDRVLVQGEVVFTDPLDVEVQTADFDVPAVVTGHVPQVDASVDAGVVVLEVSGRPVIALPGALPVYRTLRAGVSGPDVVQLREALAAIGIPAGEVTDDDYDATAARAVEALYKRIGYPAPSAGEDAEAGVDEAHDLVVDAEVELAGARASLTEASRESATRAERVRLEADVATATATLDEVRAFCAEVPEECSASEVTAAEGELASAVAARDEAEVPPDTTFERAVVAAAEKALRRARDDLAAAKVEAMTPLPAGEVVYLTGLPRRVDAVHVERGTELGEDPALRVSALTLQVRGPVPEPDAGRLGVGIPASIRVPGGGEVPGSIAALEDVPESEDGDTDDGGTGEGDDGGAEDGGPGESVGGTQVVIAPGELTGEQRTALQGQQVSVDVVVGSTAGEVLAVPLDAVITGPDGEARVEVLDGETTRLVEVTTGVAADGLVEVVGVDADLSVDDRLVVGHDTTDGTDEAVDPEEDEPAEEEAEG